MRFSQHPKSVAVPYIIGFLVILAQLILLSSCGRDKRTAPAISAAGVELPVRVVPGFFSATTSYFSPDGQRLILNARLIEQEDEYHVYTTRLDGTDIRRINSLGADAASYYFPDAERVIFTSTRNNTGLPHGDYYNPDDYPVGAELYSCRPNGSDLRRLTRNEIYEGNASVSPDGQWVLFSRMVDGSLDLWRMRPDGSDEFRITDTPDLQESGAFYLPDNRRIIFQAWDVADQGSEMLPTTIYTVNHDGTDLTRITHEDGVNWSPHPSPDGVHFVFVKTVEADNFEVFLMSLDTGQQTRLTHNDAFDGSPSFSPDGRTISFTSTREQHVSEDRRSIYLMDIQTLLE